MLNKFQKLFTRSAEPSSESQLEYIQYSQELETALRHLESHLHKLVNRIILFDDGNLEFEWKVDDFIA